MLIGVIFIGLMVCFGYVLIRHRNQRIDAENTHQAELEQQQAIHDIQNQEHPADPDSEENIAHQGTNIKPDPSDKK